MNVNSLIVYSLSICKVKVSSVDFTGYSEKKVDIVPPPSSRMLGAADRTPPRYAAYANQAAVVLWSSVQALPAGRLLQRSREVQQGLGVLVNVVITASSDDVVGGGNDGGSGVGTIDVAGDAVSASASVANKIKQLVGEVQRNPQKVSKLAQKPAAVDKRAMTYTR